MVFLCKVYHKHFGQLVVVPKKNGCKGQLMCCVESMSDKNCANQDAVQEIWKNTR